MLIKSFNYFENRMIIGILTNSYIQCDHIKKINFRKTSLFTGLLPV